MDSQEVEVVAGDKFGGDGLCHGFGQHGDLVPAVESQKPIEREVGRGLKVAQEGVRKGTDRFGKLDRGSGNGDDLIGIADGQQIENDLLDEGEDRRIRADAESQRQHGRGGKAGGFGEQARGVGEIFADIFQETDTARVAALLGRDGEGAEGTAGRIGGVALAHSCRTVFFGELLQVEGEFPLEIILHVRTPEEGAEPLTNYPYETHG